MKNNSTISNVRIPIYHKKGVEIHVRVVNGKASLEINNTSVFPRMIALAGQLSSEIKPTMIQVGSNCLQKLPWPMDDLRKIEVKVSESVEESMRLMKAFD